MHYSSLVTLEVQVEPRTLFFGRQIAIDILATDSTSNLFLPLMALLKVTFEYDQMLSAVHKYREIFCHLPTGPL